MCGAKCTPIFTSIFTPSRNSNDNPSISVFRSWMKLKNPHRHRENTQHFLRIVILFYYSRIRPGSLDLCGCATVMPRTFIADFKIITALRVSPGHLSKTLSENKVTTNGVHNLKQRTSSWHFQRAFVAGWLYVFGWWGICYLSWSL